MPELYINTPMASEAEVLSLGGTIPTNLPNGLQLHE
jgi:hypothetical protein